MLLIASVSHTRQQTQTCSLRYFFLIPWRGFGHGGVMAYIGISSSPDVNPNATLRLFS